MRVYFVSLLLLFYSVLALPTQDLARSFADQDYFKSQPVVLLAGIAKDHSTQQEGQGFSSYQPHLFSLEVFSVSFKSNVFLKAFVLKAYLQNFPSLYLVLCNLRL